MGKNLKGKDCGRGIYQRKDGLYHARYADKTGRTHSKYFKTLPEARNWLADEKYEHYMDLIEIAEQREELLENIYENISQIVDDLTKLEKL